MKQIRSIFSNQPSIFLLIVVLTVISLFALDLLNAAFAAQSSCPAANPNDNQPDDSALQACLNQGGTILLEPGNPGYIIATGIQITVDNTVLGSSGAPVLATLIADPNLSAPILNVQNKNGFTIQYIRFDGNKANRTVSCQGYRDYGSNIIIGGSSDFSISHIESNQTMCGTALQLNGSNFEIANSLFKDNGFTKEDGRSPEPWSDGITTGLCNNGYIHDNIVEDFTDVGIISGGGQRCKIENNTIRQTKTHAFAGLAIHNFALEGAGDHTDAIFQNNQITSMKNGLDLGISVGIHPWNPDLETKNGTVINNSSSGAVVNLAIDGYHDGTVKDNRLSNPQGSLSWFKGNCNFRGNYAVAHTTNACLQEDWAVMAFHGDSCENTHETIDNTCGESSKPPICGMMGIDHQAPRVMALLFFGFLLMRRFFQ